MNILRDEGETKGSYQLEKDGASEVAKLTYSKVGAKMIIIDHTEVPEEFRGTGAGVALVTRAVEDARLGGKTIVPLCPFAAAQFKRHQEWQDVLNGRMKVKDTPTEGKDS